MKQEDQTPDEAGAGRWPWRLPALAMQKVERSSPSIRPEKSCKWPKERAVCAVNDLCNGKSWLA
jgi:hypothetical protein